MSSSPKTLIKWQAPEFIHSEKSPLWFALAGSITIGIISYAILTDAASMAIVFFLLAGVYYLLHQVKPKMVDIRINEMGIQVQNTLYQFGEIAGFYIIFEPEHDRKTLHLKTSKKMAPEVIIQLADSDPVALREVLLTKITEIERGDEPLADKIIRMLRL